MTNACRIDRHLLFGTLVQDEAYPAFGVEAKPNAITPSTAKIGTFHLVDSTESGRPIRTIALRASIILRASSASASRWVFVTAVIGSCGDDMP